LTKAIRRAGQGRINHEAKCLGPTKKKGPTKAKMRKKGPTKTKNEVKGAYKGQYECNRPSFFFAPKKILKVPRAYESLNPGLVLGFIESFQKKVYLSVIVIF
jgi:hypothetical protein